MPILQPPFITDNYYHLYNRGVAKQPIFSSKYDYARFLKTLAFYSDKELPSKYSYVDNQSLNDLISTPAKQPLVNNICYCLMPNHFHLLVQQEKENGIPDFMRKSLNSYSRYYNARHNRVGPLFQGTYKAVSVTSDKQFLHVSRYILFNPYIARLCDDPRSYEWSSFQNIISNSDNRLSQPKLLEQLAGSKNAYIKFITDYADYSRSVSEHTNLFLDVQ